MLDTHATNVSQDSAYLIGTIETYTKDVIWFYMQLDNVRHKCNWFPSDFLRLLKNIICKCNWCSLVSLEELYSYMQLKVLQYLHAKKCHAMRIFTNKRLYFDLAN